MQYCSSGGRGRARRPSFHGRTGGPSCGRTTWPTISCCTPHRAPVCSARPLERAPIHPSIHPSLRLPLLSFERPPFSSPFMHRSRSPTKPHCAGSGCPQFKIQKRSNALFFHCGQSSPSLFYAPRIYKGCNSCVFFARKKEDERKGHRERIVKERWDGRRDGRGRRERVGRAGGRASSRSFICLLFYVMLCDVLLHGRTASIPRCEHGLSVSLQRSPDILGNGSERTSVRRVGVL